jgi:hypothetical protein
VSRNRTTFTRGTIVLGAAAGTLAIGAVVHSGSGADPVHAHPTASRPVAVRFTLPVAFRVEGSPGSLAIGDFNSDGHPDLATANRSSVSVLRQAAAASEIHRSTSPTARRSRSRPAT